MDSTVVGKDIHGSSQFYDDIKSIIIDSRNTAIRSVDNQRVFMYWRLGERICTEEQRGKDDASYGKSLIRNLSAQLESEFGSGFSYRQLAYCRKFYRIYPIVNALRAQLNWFQYRLLVCIEDDFKREYYELESVNNGWSGRELERQINSQLYERLLLSNDKEAVLTAARKKRIPEHQDLGQLQTYVNYFDRYEKLPEENLTVDILLCAAKNDTLVKITLPEVNRTILTSQYQLYLSSEEPLFEEITDGLELVGGGAVE
jgi:hypothetical protein